MSHVLSVCSKQWELISENPVKKISREKEPRERIRFLSPEAIFSKEVLHEIAMQYFFESDCVKVPVNPPKDCIGFQDRLLEIDEKLRSMVFGLSYDTESGKTLKREKTNENLVTALCNYEKYVKGVINEQINPLDLLKQMRLRRASCEEFVLRL